MQGVESLVEQGRPAEGDVLRGPEQGMNIHTGHNVCVHACVCLCVSALVSVIVHAWVAGMAVCDSNTRHGQLQTGRYA